jgi:hypothetical protein
MLKNTKFYCEACDYKCFDKGNYNKHILTIKHKNTIENAVSLKPEYKCEKCNFKCKKESNYKTHLNTNKHIERENIDMNTIQNMIRCECGNIYKSDKALHFHKRTCEIALSIKNTETKISNAKPSVSFIASETNTSENNTSENNVFEKYTSSKNNENYIIENVNNDMMSSIMSEIKILMVEQNKILAEQNKMNQIITDFTNKPISNNTINNNQTNNHQFNMNMFLNETCKDAMNMSEFIENLTVTMEDMEMTGTLGFAKGMSRIIMNNLNALEVHKRPIHCSDAKRETLYVKNNGVWEKDTDDKKHTKELIYKVSSLNLKHLLKWRELPRNKGYDNPDHKKNDEFTILVMEINKVKVEEIEKVVTLISKQVTIDKNKVRMSGYLN